jgi:hypothetical protein
VRQSFHLVNLLNLVCELHHEKSSRKELVVKRPLQVTLAYAKLKVFAKCLLIMRKSSSPKIETGARQTLVFQLAAALLHVFDTQQPHQPVFNWQHRTGGVEDKTSGRQGTARACKSSRHPA